MKQYNCEVCNTPLLYHSLNDLKKTLLEVGLIKVDQEPHERTLDLFEKFQYTYNCTCSHDRIMDARKKRSIA